MEALREAHRSRRGREPWKREGGYIPMKDLTSNDLRKLYLDFFASKGHAVIPSASLIPENDPTVLFTTAGMHPLVPYLLG